MRNGNLAEANGVVILGNEVKPFALQDIVIGAGPITNFGVVDIDGAGPFLGSVEVDGEGRAFRIVK